MIIHPVILQCSKQADKVQRLVHYCKELDGTELIVVPTNKKDDIVPHPVGTELGIRQIAREFRNKHFIWMEADAVPTKAGWLQAITEEYEACGRPYLMPNMKSCPTHDVASAIGVYPPGYIDILPTEFNKPPWFDLWLTRHHPELVAFAKTIQHRYGHYQGMHVMRRCQFPADKGLLFPETVLFHADPTQSIIRGGLKQRFYHTGDNGDIIAALPIIKQRGGGHLLIGPSHTIKRGRMPRESMEGARFENIRKLLVTQPYIHSVEWCKNFRDADEDFSTFRFTDWNRIDNLAEWQGRHLGRLELALAEPWLTVDAPWTGRIVCARSQRYHNPHFPWVRIVEKYGDRCLFVGHHQEHRIFQETFRCRIEHANTPSLLEMAKVLFGSEKIFTNQTSTWWVAAALGKTTIQETWPECQNSVIEGTKYLTYTRNSGEIKELEELLKQEDEPSIICDEG